MLCIALSCSQIICIYGNGTYVDGAYGNRRVHERLEIKQSQHEAHMCCSN